MSDKRLTVDDLSPDQQEVYAGIADIMNERLGIIDARLPRGVKQVLYQYDSAIYEVPSKLVEKMKSLIKEVWDQPVVIPGTGRRPTKKR